MTNRVLDCWDPRCSGVITVTEKHYRVLQDNGDTFWCPNGHANVFKESTVTRLKRKIEELKADLAAETARVRGAQDNAEYWKRRHDSRWRCPFKECGYEVDSQGSLVYHIRRYHRNEVGGAPKLAADNPPHPDDLRSGRVRA